MKRRKFLQALGIGGGTVAVTVVSAAPVVPVEETGFEYVVERKIVDSDKRGDQADRWVPVGRFPTEQEARDVAEAMGGVERYVPQGIAGPRYATPMFELRIAKSKAVK